jgi:DNA invertase Pin-like site-specific DNA recombinase
VLYARSARLWPLREAGALEEKVDQSAAYCLEHGCLAPQYQHVASGQAGRSDSGRPALARLLEAIRQGSVAVMVMRDLDRLAREDPAQSAILIEEFRATGVSMTITAS